MKIALIGTGYIAGRHAEVLTAMSDIEIVGHLDVSDEGAKNAAQKWGGRAYTDLTQMLDTEHPEAVWVCVPPFAHGEVERELIERGIPFYIEKPLDAGLKTPHEIATLLKDKPVIINAGYYWRCMEVIPKLQAMLKETPARMVRGAWHGLTPPAPWWRVEAKSGGQIVEQATHLFDLALFVLGEAKVVHATAARFEPTPLPNMDVAQASTATLEFEGGVPGVFTATCVLHATLDAGVEFFCDGRKISLNNKMLVVEDKDGRHETPVGRDPLAIADEKFIEAIRTGDASKVVCSYEDAVATQELCCQVRDFAREAVR